jgi:hypothetical protein
VSVIAGLVLVSAGAVGLVRRPRVAATAPPPAD